ncbi:AmmeMemoRadiSam system protein A [Planctomycetota bacterium]
MLALMFTGSDKTQLLNYARNCLSAHLAGKTPPDFDNPSPALLQPVGAFVSLHKQKKLRGCIGRMKTSDPLWRTIREMALAAGTQDSRFASVQVSELPALEFEISVLTPYERIGGEEDIKISRDGLMIQKDLRSGVLLPQVAAEWKWNTREFLEHTCQKAGLPGDAWQDPKTEIYRFQAVIFGD